MKLKNKSILVTGGAGFIGSHLVDALINDGCRVLVLDNLATGKAENLVQHKSNKKFKFALGSVLDKTVLSKAVRGIDIVFHLACLGVRHSIRKPVENYKVNSEGTLAVLEAASEAKVKKIIHCSSSEVYGTAQYVPMPESHPTFPFTVYGAGKLAGEALARSFHKTYELNTVVVRPFNTYGPRSHYEGDAGEMIPKSIVRLLNNKPVFIFGNGRQTRDYTYVSDIAEGLILVAKCDKIAGRTLNLGSGFEISINNLAKMISLSLSISTPKIKYFKGRPGDVLRLYADTAVSRKMIHWEPKVTIEEGIHKTITWFKSLSGPRSFLLSQEKGLNWR